MKTLITPTPGGYRIHMADHRRRKAEALGLLASEFLQAQDSHLWARAADGEFLAMVRRGAKILRTIGLHSILDLTETEAHFAFMTCRFLAIQAEVLSAMERRILQSLLIILARCCYIEIQPLAVPLVEAAQVQLQPVPHLAEAYSNLQLSHRISLADAFQLCSALTTGGSEFASLRDELNNGTEGFRDALLRIRQVETTSRKGGV